MYKTQPVTGITGGLRYVAIPTYKHIWDIKDWSEYTIQSHQAGAEMDAEDLTIETGQTHWVICFEAVSEVVKCK